MPRTCGKCGGRLTPQKGNSILAVFKCDGCGRVLNQKKRQAAKGLYIYLISDLAPTVKYDFYDSHVVIAKSALEARKMCPYGDEGDIWTDSSLTECQIIGTSSSKAARVVLSSFQAG